MRDSAKADSPYAMPIKDFVISVTQTRGQTGACCGTFKAQTLLRSVAICFIEGGKERRCSEEDGNRGMRCLCDWLLESPCVLASMSWGHAGNICCLGAPGLTLKMRKDGTSREVFSLKSACHSVYGSAY